MPYTLRITFSGMCLFAPEPGNATRPDRMHVLLPNALGHGHHHSTHVPILEFDIAHLNPGSPSTGIFAQYLIRDHVMTVGGSGASQTVCHDIVNLRSVVGKPVPAALFGNDPGGLLAARITLGAGHMSAVAKGACWEWNPHEPRRLTHQAQWTISAVGGDLHEVQLTDFEGTQMGPVLRLHPIGADDERAVQLYVRHLPSADLGPEPQAIPEPHEGDPAPHFDGYFSLYGRQTPIRRPLYRPESHCPADTDCPELRDKGESAYNCMLAAG